MLEAIYSHLARRAAMYLWMLVTFVAFGRYFTLTINVSDSLPGSLFLVIKGAQPRQGELAAFRYQGGGPYERGVLFLKRVQGCHGAVVTATDRGDGYRDYFVDGEFVGRAKTLSKAGRPLQQGPVGVIPEGYYYMAAPNPDSLDSRYALVGWVADNQIVGRGIKIF